VYALFLARFSFAGAGILAYFIFAGQLPSRDFLAEASDAIVLF